jgi:hypothetical protein
VEITISTYDMQESNIVRLGCFESIDELMEAFPDAVTGDYWLDTEDLGSD